MVTGRSEKKWALFVAMTVGVLAWGGLAAPPARGASVAMTKYAGMHPLSPHQGAFCYIDVVHLHRVPPPDTRVYALRKNGEYVFVGDPVALGYDGPKVGYYGPHVLNVPGQPADERLFCYLTGPHYHAVGPGPDASSFVLKDGVYWYQGAAPPVDRVRAWVNEAHAIKAYQPPKVDLAAAPPTYHPFQVTDQPVVLPAPPAPAGKAPGRAKKVDSKAGPLVGKGGAR